MNQFSRALLWTLLLLLILVAIDQLLPRIPARQPVFGAVRNFYLDFRNRLLRPSPDTAPNSVEAVIEQAEKLATQKPLRPAPRKKAALAGAAETPKYFYADAHGELHFAASLQEIPEGFRHGAQRLAE